MKVTIELYNAYCKWEGFKTGWVGYTSAAGDPPLTRSDVKVAEEIVRELLGTEEIEIRNPSGLIHRSFLTREEEVLPFIEAVRGEFPKAVDVVDIGGCSNNQIAFRRRVVIPNVSGGADEVIKRLFPKYKPIKDVELLKHDFDPKETSEVANRLAWKDALGFRE